MQSVQAVSTASVNTMFVIVNIEGKQALSLVDSGSTSGFINLKFAFTTTCNIIMGKSTAVRVASGGVLWSGSFIPTTKFTMCKEQFEHSFRVLDMALGTVQFLLIMSRELSLSEKMEGTC